MLYKTVQTNSFFQRDTAVKLSTPHLALILIVPPPPPLCPFSPMHHGATATVHCTSLDLVHLFNNNFFSLHSISSTDPVIILVIQNHYDNDNNTTMCKLHNNWKLYKLSLLVGVIVCKQQSLYLFLIVTLSLSVINVIDFTFIKLGGWCWLLHFQSKGH